MGDVRRIEEMQAEANELTDKSLDATRRMVATANEARAIGAKTLEQLDEQGDQLRRVEGQLDHINSNVRQTEKHLTNMEKCCGLCVCPWNRRQNFEKSKEYGEAYSSGSGGAGGAKAGGDGVVDSQPGMEMSARNRGGGGRASGGGDRQYIQKVFNDDREDEMNDNLGAVVDLVSELKEQAKVMGGELDEQNDILDRVNQKAHSNAARVTTANERAAAILRNA
eukprot:m.57156 g.57156  ORF g.57156 m.57156 type:complete len:223 (-) comp12707_c0_seq1:61-729(-)